MLVLTPVIQLPVQDAVRTAALRGAVLPLTYYGQRQSLHRQMSFTVSRATSLAQVEAIRHSLNTALSNGENFRQWKTRILAEGVDTFNLPAHRLETIFRTNIQVAYSLGVGQRAERLAKSHPYLMYDAINDSRVRPSHLAMDKIILLVSDPWWAKHRPPNGFNCRCRVILLTAKEAARRGITQRLPENAEPDTGWDYDPWASPTLGVSQSLRAAADRAGVANFRAGIPLRAAGSPMQTIVRTTDPSIAATLFEVSAVHGHTLTIRPFVLRGLSTAAVLERVGSKMFSAIGPAANAAAALGAILGLVDGGTDADAFARVYAHYVARRSGSAALLRAMGGALPSDAQRAIDDIMDALFKQLGWVVGM